MTTRLCSDEASPFALVSPMGVLTRVLLSNGMLERGAPFRPTKPAPMWGWRAGQDETENSYLIVFSL